MSIQGAMNDKQSNASKVNEILENLLESISTIKEEINEVVKEINVKIDEREKQIREKIEEIEKDIGRWEEKVKRVVEERKQSEAENRKKNIIIFGLEEEVKERTLVRVATFFEETMGMDVLKYRDLDNAWRVGRGSGRPILVKFTTVITRNSILMEAKRLKGTKISIAEDLDFETRMKRKELLPRLKRARHEGDFAVFRADKLMINGRIYEDEAKKGNEEGEWMRNGSNKERSAQAGKNIWKSGVIQNKEERSNQIVNFMESIPEAIRIVGPNTNTGAVRRDIRRRGVAGDDEEVDNRQDRRITRREAKKTSEAGSLMGWVIGGQVSK